MSLQPATTRKKRLTTWVVIRHLSAAKTVYLIAFAVIGAGNLVIFALYQFAENLFDQWIGFFGPEMLAMSKFLPALRGFSEHIEKT